MDAELLDAINRRLEHHTGKCLNHPQLIPVTGGDTCQSYRLFDSNSRTNYFLKTQTLRLFDTLIGEQEGLRAIANTRTIRTPDIIGYGQTTTYGFLLMEYLPLKSTGKHDTLGEQLAKLHRHTHTHFGFSRDNNIGLSIQKNCYEKNWATFWREQRLQVQLELAYRNHFHTHLEPFEKALLEASDHLLNQHRTQPSLVHGDLWGGNKAFLENGSPVIFDPAVYYGDREVDIAMTRLFGGFDEDFYRAYDQAWPLPQGAKKRISLYNLYHQLNHLNLFGQGYLSDCVNSIKSILQITA